MNNHGDDIEKDGEASPVDADGGESLRGEGRRAAKTRTEAEARQKRAAQKLRENLQRRKLQQRSRRAGSADEAEGLPAASGVSDED